MKCCLHILTCLATVLLASTTASSAEPSPEQIDTITSGLQQYRGSWTRENTAELLQRSSDSGKARFSLKTDQGATVIVEIQEGSHVLADGVSLDAGAPRPLIKRNRENVLLYVIVALSFLLALSVLLNLSLLLRRRGAGSARSTDVIRNLTRF